MMYEVLKYQVVGAAVIFSVYTDIRYGKIFNKLTFPLFFSGFIYNILFKGLNGFLSSLIGSLLAFVPFFIFFQMGGLGGGDVKLLAGIGAWLGYPLILWVIFFTAISGLLISIIFALLKGKMEILLKGMVEESKRGARNIFISLLTRNFTFYDSKEKFKFHIPYSVAIALGTFIGVFLNFWVQIPLI